MTGYSPVPRGLSLGSHKASLDAYTTPVQARRMQHPSVWLPGRAAGPGHARAAVQREPGSWETQTAAVSRGPGWPGATINILIPSLVYD